MLRKQSGRPIERYNKWGDARYSFRALMILGDLATHYIRDKHPLFANTAPTRGGRQSLASGSSTDQLLNDSEAPRIISKRGRPKKSTYLPEDNEPRYLSSRRVDNEEVEGNNEEGGRRRRNAGVPRHFENMVMMDHKKRKHDYRDKDIEDEDSDAPAEGYNQDGKRKRGRPSKTHDRNEPAPREGKSSSASAAAPAAPSAPTKKMGFPEFCEQLRDFFRVIGAWYGVSGPVILHYLREQILPVLRMLSVRQLPKDTITDLFLQISRTLSYKDITASFMNLMTIGRGFPFYAAIIHALKLYDPDNLYGMKSMHFFVDAPPIQVITIYLRKVVEALDPVTGKETFRQIATLMDEVVCEWKDYSIPLEQRLQKIVEIDRLLPDHCRGLRARLYHVLMLPTTVLSRVLQQQQELDEAHVLRNAANMVGDENAKLLRMVGVEALKETGIVPSGIPNTVLFNNVAYIKPVTSHPALATLSALGVASHIEQPISVVNRVYSSYPSSEHVMQRDAEARNAAGRVQFAAGTAGGAGLNFANVAPYAHYPQYSAEQAAMLGSQQMSQQMHQHHLQQHGDGNKHVYANGAHALSNGMGFSNNFPAGNYSFNPLYMDPTMGLPPPDMYGGYDATINPYMTSPDGNYSAYHHQQMLPMPLPAHMNANMNTSMAMNMSSGMQMPPLPPLSVGSSSAPQQQPGMGHHMPGQQAYHGAPAAASSSGHPSPADESTIAFLRNAHSKVQEQFKAPFLGAVKDLVKSLRDPKTPAEEIEARVLVVSSFVPHAEEELLAEIKSTFTVENFKPYLRTAAADTADSSASAGAVAGPSNASSSSSISSGDPRLNAVVTPNKAHAGRSSAFPSYLQQYNAHIAQQQQQQQQAHFGAHQQYEYSDPRSDHPAYARSYYDPQAPSRAQPASVASGAALQTTATAGSAPSNQVQPLSKAEQKAANQAAKYAAKQAAKQADKLSLKQSAKLTTQQIIQLQQQQAKQAQQKAESNGHRHPAADYADPAMLGDVNSTQLLLPSIKQMEHTRTSDLVTSVADNTSSLTTDTVAVPPAVPSIPPLLLSKYPLSSVSQAGVVHDGADHATDPLSVPTQPSASQAPTESNGTDPAPGSGSPGLVDWASVHPLGADTGSPQPLSTAAKISAMRSSLGAKLPRPVPAGVAKYNSGGISAKAAMAASLAAAAASSAASAPSAASSSTAASAGASTATSAPRPTYAAVVASQADARSEPAVEATESAFPLAPAGPPVVHGGIMYPYIAPFPYPEGYVAPTAAALERSLQSSSSAKVPQGAADGAEGAGSAGGVEGVEGALGAADGANGAASEAAVDASNEEVEGEAEEEDAQPVNTANFSMNKRKASLAAGPMRQGEDKQLQLQKAIAFFFDPEGTHHELSLTLLSEKFRVNHAKLKTALQNEISRRVKGWNEALTAKLDEVLALHKSKSRKDSSYSLAMAAEAKAVPYGHALLWYIRGKATINRFRTKPSEFKVKLHDMFVAYFKSLLVKNSTESRASISRRFQMTPALFSRKLMELTDDNKAHYQKLAAAQVTHRHPLEIAEINSFPVYMADPEITGSFTNPLVPLATLPASAQPKPTVPRVGAGGSDSSSVQAYRNYLRGTNNLPTSSVPLATAASTADAMFTSTAAAQTSAPTLLPSIASANLPSGPPSYRQTPEALNALLKGPPVLQAPNGATGPAQSRAPVPVSTPRVGQPVQTNVVKSAPSNKYALQKGAYNVTAGAGKKRVMARTLLAKSSLAATANMIPVPYLGAGKAAVAPANGTASSAVPAPVPVPVSVPGKAPVGVAIVPTAPTAVAVPNPAATATGTTAAVTIKVAPAVAPAAPTGKKRGRPPKYIK